MDGIKWNEKILIIEVSEEAGKLRILSAIREEDEKLDGAEPKKEKFDSEGWQGGDGTRKKKENTTPNIKHWRHYYQCCHQIMTGDRLNWNNSYLKDLLFCTDIYNDEL